MGTITDTIDKLFGEIKDLSAVRSAGPQFEAFLGELETEGQLDNESVDEGWIYFCKRCLDFVEVEPIEPADARSALYDNYFHYALNIALQRDALIDQPVIAWAAFNKKEYRGYKDEIACVRLLLAVGFNPDLPDDNGCTALHHMVCWNNPPFGNLRALRLIYERGGNINAQNNNGDTALIYLSACGNWFPIFTEAGKLLLEAGADASIAASDGSTALSLLNQMQAQSPDEGRAELIAYVEKSLLASSC